MLTGAFGKISDGTTSLSSVTGTQVMAAHVMDFEHWTYRYLMSQGKLCVYGD